MTSEQRCAAGARTKEFSYRKSDRILKRIEYVRLSAHGRKIQNSNFVLMFQKGKTSRSRLGITVSKKVGSAVVRNRVKRRIRESFRCHRQQMSDCWDFNVIAKHSACRLSPSECRRSLIHLFQRIEREHHAQTGAADYHQRL